MNLRILFRNHGWRKVLGVNSLVALSALGACGGDPASGHYVGDIVTRTGFEDAAGWGADFNALTRERAHSGRFAIFVNASREYSLTYHLPLRDASVHQIRALEVSAWVYLTSDKDRASLNVQLGQAGGDPAPLYNGQLDLVDAAHEFGKWTKVHHVFVLPANAPGESELRIFVWRQSSPNPVYLDDLEVKARE